MVLKTQTAVVEFARTPAGGFEQKENALTIIGKQLSRP
jgi:hypothetical protein